MWCVRVYSSGQLHVRVPDADAERNGRAARLAVHEASEHHSAGSERRWVTATSRDARHRPQLRPGRLHVARVGVVQLGVRASFAVRRFSVHPPRVAQCSRQVHPRRRRLLWRQRRRLNWTDWTTAQLTLGGNTTRRCDLPTSEHMYNNLFYLFVKFYRRRTTPSAYNVRIFTLYFCSRKLNVWPVAGRSQREAYKLSLNSLSYTLLLLSISSISMMMMRLLSDVSIWLCLAPWPSLRQIVCSSCLCVVLYSLSASLVVFLDFFVQLWNSASLLLAAVHCPSLTHAQTMSVFAVLFCQRLSFPSVVRTVSFFIRSCLVIRNNLLSHVISATRILRSSSFLRHQHSEPCNTIWTTPTIH